MSEGNDEMPRIYYNSTDHDVQLVAFFVHAVIYTIGMVLVSYWVLPFANSITLLWTLILTYHSYWRTPLTDGMQFRTYTRLRNRFGKDWDLAATREEFDLERKKAALELKLKHVVPDTSFALAASGASFVGLFLLNDAFPLTSASLMLTGWLCTILILQLTLRIQLRQTNQRYDALKKKQVDDMPLQHRTQDLESHSGTTLILGDDGELIEIPKKSNYDRL